MPKLFSKFYRETIRVGQQIAAFPAFLCNFALGTYFYDHHLSKKVLRYEGHLKESSQVAIFMIYPSLGLKPSHFQTLSYLQSMGYATQVVSNVPLSVQDREALLQHCWRYIERPNYGYDFGGYRDGILALEADLKRLDRIFLLNDSTWFPIQGARNWLEDVEAMDVDFTGAISHFGTLHPKIENYSSIVWRYSSKRKDFHYGSFALCIRPAIFRDPRFLNFWKKFRLSNDKKQTIRRGEIGFTQWVLSRGFTHGATFDVSRLDLDLEALDVETLLKIAQNLIIPELPHLSAMAKQITAKPDVSKSELMTVILYAVARQGASYALAPYAVAMRGFPFLKKSPLWLNTESAEITLRLLESIPDSKAIREEALALQRGRNKY